MPENKKLLIIDANALIHRAFHALPPLTTKSGEQVNAVYGFLLVLFRALKEFQPEYAVAAFDFPGKTFRHEKFEQYKAKRPKAPAELYNQIPLIKNVLAGFNIPVFEKQGFEADDIIGTIADKSAEESVIISGDMDILQLVNAKTRAYILKRGIKEAILYDTDEVKKKYEGIGPGQLADFKGLRGDPSDNIPGVLGVGEKTALDLLKQFGTLENIYKEIDKVKPAIKKKLVDHKDLAFLSRDLGEINKDIPIDFDLEKSRFGQYDQARAIKILEEFNFYSLINKLPQIDKAKAVRESLKLW